jgi:hypothetical protein
LRKRVGAGGGKIHAAEYSGGRGTGRVLWCRYVGRGYEAVSETRHAVILQTIRR